MSLSKLGALRVADTRAFERIVRATMGANGGRIPDAARHLGVSERTLFRWLSEAPLTDCPRVANGEPRTGRRGCKSGTCYECKHASASAPHPLVPGALVCEGCMDGLR